MKENRKLFWVEALKGGTIIGLVSVAFDLLTRGVAEQATLATVLGYASTVITILLIFALVRKFAASHSASVGFAYGRGVGYVVAMMAFAGVIAGFYTAILTNFFIREEVLASVDAIIVDMQDMLPAESFESTYDLMRASVLNPLFLTISSVLSNTFLGVLVGLFVSLLTRRQPDIFAPEEAVNDN